MTSYEIIARYVPEPVRTALLKADSRNVTEIRFRSGRAVTFVYPDRIKFLSDSGRLYDSPENCLNVSAEFIKNVVGSLSHYSLHSCDRELKQGFFTVENGIRVGIAGTYSDNGVIRDFNALNFRVSRCIEGCAESVFAMLKDYSILICGGVNSGKTTFLRDFCRLCGNSRKITLIDERCEISSVSGGNVLNDVGLLTDVVSGCGRAFGIVSAIRTLSPDFIFCDEISSDGDRQAILSGAGCGIKFVATVHAENFEGLLKREFVKDLITRGIFDYAVFLYGSSSPSKVREIRRLGSYA